MAGATRQPRLVAPSADLHASFLSALARVPRRGQAAAPRSPTARRCGDVRPLRRRPAARGLRRRAAPGVSSMRSVSCPTRTSIRRSSSPRRCCGGPRGASTWDASASVIGSTTSLLREGGNIGYDVRPSARRRGHATAMLAAALPVAAALGIDRARIDCDVTNIASRRVIEKNGGLFEKEERGSLYFWVPTGDGRATAVGRESGGRVRRPAVSDSATGRQGTGTARPATGPAAPPLHPRAVLPREVRLLRLLLGGAGAVGGDRGRETCRRLERFIEAAHAEWAAEAARQRVRRLETVYVGGGTPSLLGRGGLERLLAPFVAGRSPLRASPAAAHGARRGHRRDQPRGRDAPATPRGRRRAACASRSACRASTDACARRWAGAPPPIPSRPSSVCAPPVWRTSASTSSSASPARRRPTSTGSSPPWPRWAPTTSRGTSSTSCRARRWRAAHVERRR